MERTDELNSLLAIYMGIPRYEGAKREVGASPCLDEAVRCFVGLKQSNELVDRISRLSLQREFSNDPTVALSSTSALFKKKVSLIQNDLKKLERLIANPIPTLKGGKVEVPGMHAQHHHKLILQILQNEASAQMTSIQTAIKAHSENVKLRQKRVERYGSNIDVMSMAAESMGPSTGSKREVPGPRPPAFKGATPQEGRSIGNGNTIKKDDGPAPKNSGGGNRPGASRFAMFSVDSNTSLRRRGGVALEGSGGFGASMGTAKGGLQEQQFITPRGNQYSRLQTAERVEASIVQMGALFGQVANLVLQQGETISRIEDDVEAGLMDTEEGHKEMQRLLEITKGNRGIILKIFALLVFFILLFMFWT